MAPNDDRDDDLDDLEPDDFGGNNGLEGIGALTVKLDGIAQGIDGLAEVSQANRKRLDRHSQDIRGWAAVDVRLQLLQGLSVSLAKALTGVEVRQDRVEVKLETVLREVRRMERLILAVAVVLAILEVLT